LWCLYFDKECSIIDVEFSFAVDWTAEKLAAFCNCCITKNDSDRLTKELRINRMGLIANLLALFPNDEKKAKEAYQMLQRCLKDWEVK